MDQVIYLYGAPGSGKSTLGRRLATALNAEFVDLDGLIVTRAGQDIPSIFAKEGESAFRALESQTLRTMPRPGPEGRLRIVALGGGTLLDEANRNWCESNGIVVCLETPSAEELSRRLAADGAARPLGNRAQERAAHYASFANRIVATYELGDSLIVIGNGIAPALVSRQAGVVDATVQGLHGPKLPRCIATVPSGEVHKTPATVSELWHAFAASGLGRQDSIVAVGGGVTGDLTGFAAATFMRGIDWINVPTTLLAMVDASTGGKTGCDLPEGKNLAGAFHPPRLVVIDTDFLQTLPEEVFREGLAEMIKHEVIGGRIEGGVVAGAKVSAAVIAANLAVKIGIVREDPLERTGRRMLLNCGHTVAHAVEKLFEYGISHGRAVAMGCVAEARMAVRKGMAPADWPDELASVFAKAGLPTELPRGVTWEQLVPIMKSDKKRSGDEVTFALPCGWGEVKMVKVHL